ncbi:MAG TPA: 2OG-Fe(II) oxygenase [Noviherbaspirillum sp.]|jgi:prolyl 4-hydroxylase|uniref:2OG-Fe(II) oxygenase n=1 Tax=Noviherbaspirillum sp. TaxID=1926288 RepID=UPI002F94070D
MMNSPALSRLPQEWQHWINENLARRCEPHTMAAVMVRDGHFDAMLARTAIEEARRASFPREAAAPARQAQPLPTIDTSVNVVRALDRDVEIVLSLRSPRVVVVANLLSDEECDELIAYSAGRLERSPVVADSDGKTQVHAHRTSRGAMLQRAESALVARIEARLEALTGWPAERGEGLQVLRYEKGNEYRPHFDWFDPSTPGPRKHLERGGQRVGTIVMYLSDVEQGGGTSFPKAGLQVQPKKGGAVFFNNTDEYGEPDQMSLHAGEPVEKGVKVVATKWMRQRAYV